MTLAIRLLISTIQSQATVTPLLHWLSTKHNLIDLAEKAFPASELKDTSKKELTRNLILQIWMKRIKEGFKNSIPKD